MNSEKVKEIKELLRCMNGEKACTNCYINEVAQEQETFCINVVADMTLDLISELESENERLIEERDLYKSQFNELEPRFLDLMWDNNELKNRIVELKKENEILQGTKDRLTFADRIELVNNAVESKLKQFAERLKEKADGICIKNDILYAINSSDIDETLKECINNK